MPSSSVELCHEIEKQSNRLKGEEEKEFFSVGGVGAKKIKNKFNKGSIIKKSKRLRQKNV